MPVSRRSGGGNARQAFVLVHCLPGDSAAFELLAPRLADEGTVVLVDLPDCGTSPDAHSLDPDDAVDDVRTIIAGLAPVPVVLVGVSFGAWASARLASLAPPSNLAGLVLVGGLAGMRPVVADAYRTMATDLDAGRTELPAVWQGLMAGCFPTEGTPEARASVNAMVGRISRERAVRALHRVAGIAADDRRAGAFETPAVALHARHDAVTPLEDGVELARLGRHTRLQIIESDAHLLTLTHVDACLAAIRSVALEQR